MCQLLSQLLEDHDSGRHRQAAGVVEHSSMSSASNGSGSCASSFVPPEVLTEDSSGGGIGIGRGTRNLGGSPPMSGLSSPATPPEWLLNCVLSNGGSRECTIETYARVRSGWCCKRYVLEAILFGVLMPLATAGYWLADASTREGHSSFSNHWLPAACELYNPLVVSRQVYHHGKYADAKDLAYQEGRVWRLEPAFNTSVKLYLEYGSRYAFSARNWPQMWWATTLTSVVEEERPHCDGQVRDAMQLACSASSCRMHARLPFGSPPPNGLLVRRQVMDSTEETRARCDTVQWIPRELVLLNGTQPCFVDRTDRRHVYLNIEDPSGLYLDIITICACFGIAIGFTFCILTQHKGTLKSWYTSYCTKQGAAESSTGKGNGAGASRSGLMLTPENIKAAYHQVKKGFTEMV